MSVIKSLESTLAEKKAAKYDVGLEERIRQWIATLAEQPVEGEFSLALRDGMVLCQVMNKMCPNLIPRVHNSPLPFKQMENITTFIKCCQMLGLQATELFETPDLYNAADMMRVLQCLDRLMQVHEKYDQETLLARIAEYKSSNVSSPLPATRVASSTTVRPWQKRQAEAQAQAQAQTQVQQQPGEVPAPTFPDRLDSPISVPMASTPSVSSLHEDIATRSEFKYSAELERVAREWMEQILNEDLSKPSFAECLKSGVMLCRLLNTIKPGLVTNKIHLTKIKYHQMENIEHFLQGCQALGVESVNLFNTTDLFEEKAMFLVINSIIVLANNVKSKPWYTGPVIADTSKAKSLWSESLGFTDFSLEEEKEDDDEQEQKPLSPEEQDLVDWFNTQVAKASVPVRPIKNLSTNIRSGVALMRLVEVLTTQKRTAWEAQPKYLWQHMKNATAVLNFIASVTFEQLPNVTARDIVSMRVESIVLLLTYLRDKFDLDFLFQKLLNEDLKDEEKEIHMHVTTAVADQEEVYYEGEEEYYIEGEDGEYYEDDEWYGEDASVQGEHAVSATSESTEAAEAAVKAEAERRREQEEKVNSEMAAAVAAAAREAEERERAAKQAQTDEEEKTKRQAEEQQIADEQKEKLRVEAVEAEALQKEAEKQKQAQEAEAEKKAESQRLELEQQEAEAEEKEKEKEKEKERLRAEREQQEELEREQERKKKLEQEELENKEKERREKEERKKEKEELRKKKAAAAAAAAAAEENEQQKRVELEKLQSKSSSAETVEPVPSAVVSTSAEQKEATEEELARKREKRRAKKEKAAKLEKEKSGEHVEEAKKEKREKKAKKEKTGEQAEEAKKEKKARKEKTGESVEEAKSEKGEKKRKSSRRESSRRDMKKKVEKKASSKKSTKDDDKESKDEAAVMGASSEMTAAAAAPAVVVVIVAPSKEGEAAAAVVEEPKKLKRKGSSKREKKRTSTREKRSEIRRSPEEQKPPSTEEAAVSASSQNSAPATAVVVVAEPAKEEIAAASAETTAAQNLGDGEEVKPLAAVDEPKPTAPAEPAPAELPTTDQPQPQEQQREAEKPLEDHGPLEEDSPAKPEQGLAPQERRQQQHEVPEVVVVPATNGVALVSESPRDSSGAAGAKPRSILPLRGMPRRRGSVIGRGGAVAGAAGVPRVHAHPGEQTVEGSQIRTTRIASAASRQEAGAHLPKTEALQDIQAIKMEKARNVVRLRVASEILSTETSYANSLSLVSKHVLSVILKAEGRILTATECQNLFWNWDELCGHHTRFLQLIKERIEKWDISTTIGDIFLHHTDFLSRYRPFLEGYNTSVVTLRHLEKRKPAFKVVKQAFEAEQKKTTFLDLESFLIMPIQRIPRYSLLLRTDSRYSSSPITITVKELHKYTNPLHPDYALLEQAATKISKQLSELNAGIDNDQTTCALKLHSIEDSIEGEIVPGETLFNPTRRYVREGVMQLTWKDAKEKQLYFFLFTDLLVCCDKKKGGKKGPGEEFSLLFSLPLGTVLRLDESQLEKKGKLTLVVSEEKGKDKLNYGLTIKDKREKALWAADLKTCVEDAKKPAATKS